MKILVCISHVPDTNTKVVIDGDGKSINKTGVSYVICPYDEFALSRAVEFKEKGQAKEIIVICVGGPETDATIRKALAIGADSGVRVNAEPKDSYFVAKQIAEYAKSQNFDLIMMGKESIDFNGSQVPGMVGEMLDMPDISFATSIQVNGSVASLTREIDGGEELLDCTLPLVMSCQKGVAEWRIPNVKGIMDAKRKPVAVIEPVATQETTKLVTLTLPAQKQSCVYFTNEETDKIVQILASKGAL